MQHHEHTHGRMSLDEGFKALNATQSPQGQTLRLMLAKIIAQRISIMLPVVFPTLFSFLNSTKRTKDAEEKAIAQWGVQLCTPMFQHKHPAGI